MSFGIGEVAKRLGCNVQTLRYYEQIGLVAPAHRTEGGQRRYGQTDLDRLKFIRHSRELGFPLDSIRTLLKLSRHRDEPCNEADALAREQLKQVRSRIARLQALESELAAMVEQCECNVVANCRVIEVLGNHDLCRHEDHVGAHAVRE